MSLLAMGMLTVGLNLLPDFQILPASAGEDQIPAISFCSRSYRSAWKFRFVDSNTESCPLCRQGVVVG